MRTLTVQEVLEYAIGIEEESFRFYRHAGTVLSDKRAVEVVHVLADEEMKHMKLLIDLRKKPGASSTGNEERLMTEYDPSDTVISTEKFDAATSKHAILNRALEREEKTRDLYDRIYEMATMSVPIRDTFRLLRDQEQEHIQRVKVLMSTSDEI
jgi:rubrerythrin